MTLPDERYRSLRQAKKLMEDLVDPGKSPRVPRIIRERALGALRHFPSDWELESMATKCPELLDTQPFSAYNIK